MKAFAYLRVSGLGQINGDGFQRQREEIQKYADKADIEIVEWFQEEGISGTTDKEDRPAFQEMVSRILANGVKTIVVEGLDRLAREYRIQETLLVYLASKGITLINARTEENVTEAVMADPMRKALIQIQGIFAELEKGLLVKKLRSARDRKREKEGRCEGRKVFLETAEGREVLSMIKKLRRKPKLGVRKTFDEIATELNARGYKSSIGKPWSGRMISELLIKARNSNVKGE